MDELKAELFLDACKKSRHGVAILSGKGEIEWVNHRFCELCGFKKDKLEDKTISVISDSLKDIGSLAEKGNNTIITSGKNQKKNAILSLSLISDMDEGSHYLAELTSFKDAADNRLREEVKQNRR